MKNKIQKKNLLEDIENIHQRREDRKLKEEKRQNENQNKTMDIDYEKMIQKKKTELSKLPIIKHKNTENSKISVIIRKRPLSKKEISNGEIDCITCINPKIIVHECKMKIDGLTKFLEDNEFYFDNTFNENESTEDLYKYSISPMINFILNKGIVTCFAYGQTGSGKTYTMKGIQNLSIESLFQEISKIKNKKFQIYISFFEIYGGRLYDLLNNKNKLQVLDDKNGKVQIFNLEEILVENSQDLHYIIEKANSIRTTHNTVTNSTSSRSHAICNIIIKEEGLNAEYGKLSLVDLAGSERAQETQSNNRQRRAEGAEINKSLLALKECIRALEARRVNGNSDIHVPFRASKLTHVLRDSFVCKSDKSRIIMISCVNPSFCSSNHSINTLRYSDRLKEQTNIMSKGNYGNNGSNCYNNFNGEKKIRGSSSCKSNRNNNCNLNGKNNKNGFGNKKNVDNNSDNSYDNINMNVFNVNDDILNDINNNKSKNNINKCKNDNNSINKKRIESPKNNKISPSKNNIKNNKKENKKDIIEEEVDDLIYLKQTISKGGKYISDDFIKYNQLTGKIVEAEDQIVNTHMNVIKNDAKMLTDEGELITKIKGLNNEYYSMDEYVIELEQMIDKKISLYSDLKGKLNIYKKHIKEEDEMRKMHPQLFIDAAEI